MAARLATVVAATCLKAVVTREEREVKMVKVDILIVGT